MHTTSDIHFRCIIETIKTTNVLPIIIIKPMSLTLTVTRSKSTFSWRRGVVVSVVRHMNEVTLRRARLVLGYG